MFRWIGEVMKSQLTGLKPVQLTELETEFGNMEGVGKAKAERWLRSPKPLKTKVEADEDGEKDDSQQSDLDPYELLDPVEST